MSKTVRQKYDEEFKESSVALALKSDIPISETAKNLGIHKSTLSSCISIKKSSKGLPMSTSQNEDKQKIKQLEKELARVTEERDLLKKATAYFAKQSQ